MSPTLTQAHIPRAEAQRLLHYATLFSVLVACLLVGVKMLAWQITGSLSLLSSLADSALDVLASGINLVAVRYALQPPDKEHRFGHGKAEDLAGLAQALFIASSGLFICIEAIKRLIHPQPLEDSLVGIIAMSISICATLLLIGFQRYVIRKTGSNIIRADSLHYSVDFLSNAAVIIALLLAGFMGWQQADPFFALGIVAYILYSAWDVARASFQNLMDHEFSDAEREQIVAIIHEHPGALGVHDLKTRRSGINSFIQFHLDLNENLSLKDAHEIAENVEKNINKLFPNTGVIIHQDPVSISPKQHTIIV